MELYPQLKVRTTSDTDITTIYLRAENRVDPRLEFKDGLAGLYGMIDKSVTVTLDGRLFAVMSVEGDGSEFRPVWTLEGFDENVIRSLIENWHSLATAAMEAKTEATS
jgi:hypothetical protein